MAWDLFLMIATDSVFLFVSPLLVGLGFSTGWHIVKRKYDKKQ